MQNNINPITKERYLAENLGISLLFAKVLLKKGFENTESSLRYLYPIYSHIADTAKVFPDMDLVTTRIREAIEEKQPICIYGDYDVDGITSTAILLETLTYLGAKVSYHIPHRFKEGYGLNKESIEKLCSSNKGLLITVDCGVTSNEEIDLANELGNDVIVIDHHQAGLTLPNAIGFILPTPKLKTNFAAAGLAFKVAQALLEKDINKKDFLLSLMDLAALGTIIDIAPLVGENRTISYLGLNILNKLARPGLKALTEIAQIEPPFTGEHLGFMIGPRLNAAGRMEHAKLAVELLLTKDPEEGGRLAGRLHELNDLRKKLTDKIVTKCEKEIDLEKASIIIPLADVPEETHGITGLIASKLNEKYKKIAIVVVENPEHPGVFRGSGRSSEEISLLEGLRYCDDLLDSYGGHFVAAGLAISEPNLIAFQTKLDEYVNTAEKKIKKVKTKSNTNPHTIEIDLDDINEGVLEELKQLEPFGSNNIDPLWKCTVDLAKPAQAIGKKQNHLLLYVTDNKTTYKALGWRMATPELVRSLSDQRYSIPLVFRLALNEWQNKTALELRIVEINV